MKLTQEQKQILLTDLCGRLPYGVKINVNGEEDILLELGVNTGWINASYKVEDVKPYLRPMSSMTEEECKELGELSAIIENVGETLPNAPYYIEVARPEQIDWLNNHHFDYRGLIEKGLALEVPEGMYKEN